MDAGFHESQEGTYTGISDIINMQQRQLNIKKNAVLTYLLMKKDSLENTRMKSMGMARWKNFMREVEMWSIKNVMKRLMENVENLKF